MKQYQTKEHTMTEQTTPKVEQIDPTQAVVGINVRADARLDKAFVASIRERGVLEPVIGYRDEQGQFVVLRGQRRTLAAVEAKRDTIPAYVGTSPDEADRIIDQMAENEHRAPMATGERVAALATLAGLGLTAAQIAKRTATKRSEVDASLTVAASPLASKAAERFDFLTLEQAVTLAEFEDDTEAVKALAVAAKQGQFDHLAQRLRDDRRDADLLAAAAASLAEQGIPQVDRPGYDDKAMVPLHRLRHDGKDLDPADVHAQCPGHAAYVALSWASNDAGERIRAAAPHFVCTDWRKQGHTDTYASTSSKPKAADLTPAEREKAKAERRDVIESNKAWDSAQTVRREWVKNFLTRRTAPKGSAPFTARIVTTHGRLIGEQGADRLAAEWFGLATAGYGRSAGWDALIAKATEGRAQVVALGLALSAVEAKTGRHSWRSVDAATAAYLTFLAANGYSLSPVEQRAAGTAKKKHT